MNRRTLAAVASLVLLGGCVNGQLTPQAQAFLQVACQQDQMIQPISATVISTLLPQSTPIVAVDNGVIHPAIQAYCKSLGMTAVTVSNTSVVAPSK